jgi:hypothetical protein
MRCRAVEAMSTIDILTGDGFQDTFHHPVLDGWTRGDVQMVQTTGGNGRLRSIKVQI